MGQPIASMTGYARAAGAAAGMGFAVEIKSVNGRGLDLRLRLAPGYDALETAIRRRLGELLTRGSVTLGLAIDRLQGAGPVLINREALDTVLAAIEDLVRRADVAQPRPEAILALPGVLQQRESALSTEAEAELHAAILAAVDRALADLQAARREEGGRLVAVLAQRLAEIEALTAAAEKAAAADRATIPTRLRQQLAELTTAGSGVGEDRLAQEVLLLATKADVREELDRLTAHIAAARKLLAEGGAVGRKLDFLSQEFNREANTLCSKSSSIELTAIGLDLKAVIDQLREQVQNIE